MGFALTPGEAPLHFSRSKNVMHVDAVIDPGEALQWTQWDMNRIGWEVCNGA